MKILLDTNAYNTYIAAKPEYGYEHQFQDNINIDYFVEFVDENKGHVVVHSATLFELYIKCIKNNKIQRSFKEKNQLSIEQFVTDYNCLKKYRIRLINDNACYFDNKKITEPELIISDKVRCEVDYFSRFYRLVLAICADVLFDKYEDIVDVNLFSIFLDVLNFFMEKNIAQLLNDHYYEREKKDTTKRTLDSLLYYLLTQLEECIINQTTLVQSPQEVILFLNMTFLKFSQTEIKDGAGTEKAHQIVCEGKETRSVVKLITKVVDTFINELEKSNKPTLRPTEKGYILYLLKKLFINKYKVRKNDFSDYLILTSCDGLKEQHFPDQEIIFITFDHNLKSFIEKYNIYFNKDIYEKIFSR